MASGVTPAVVLQGLRWWAQGALPDQAAVELLARSSGGRLLRPGVPWVRPCRRPGWYWLDGDALIAHAASLPDGPQRDGLLLAALLLDGDTTQRYARPATRRAAA